MTRSFSAEVLPPLARSSVAARNVIALIVAFLASGILPNDVSYVAVAVLLIVGLRTDGLRFSGKRRLIILLTLAVVLYGSVKGYFVGHDVEHIARFALPLMAFAVICSMPGLGLLLYQARGTVLFVIAVLTLSFFYTIQTGNRASIESYMAGWTVTYSSSAGVSVWHYFCVPFCFIAINQAWNGSNRGLSLLQAAVGFGVLGLLVLLTDTSAFLLALAFCTILIFARGRVANTLSWMGAAGLGLLIADFLTVKILCSAIVEFVAKSIDDVGDMLRLVQLDYFVRNSEFFGSGFGARHSFPFEMDFTRQTSQTIYPYASELPIINIIYNGGILAGVWFFLFALVLRSLADRGHAMSDNGIRNFGLACSAIFIGSMSNPFLFSPASMLLLAVIFDIYDWSDTQRVLHAPRRRQGPGAAPFRLDQKVV